VSSVTVPYDCRHVWQALTGILDQALHARRGGWYSTRDLFLVTGRPSAERKARKLVEIGLVERRHVPDRKTGGLFAEFRALPQGGVLFDLPPPTPRPLDLSCKGKAIRQPKERKCTPTQG